MRWRCTVESAEKNEFSALALVESLLAVSASLYIAWHFQTMWHIIAASFLAPFLLLRTDESTRRGLNAFQKIFAYISDIPDEEGQEENYSLALISIGTIFVTLLLSVFSSTITIVWLILGPCCLLFFWLETKGILKIENLPFLPKIVTEIIAGLVVFIGLAVAVVGGVGAAATVVVAALVVLAVAVTGETGGVVGGGAGVMVMAVVVGAVVAGRRVATVAVEGVAIVVEGAGVSLFCKVWATLAVCITSPWQSLKAVPGNWTRIVFCVDMCHPPELMPGMEEEKYKELSERVSHFRFGRWIFRAGSLFNTEGWFEKFLAFTVFLLTPLLYLPALAYRWSLKSSSLIWLPLIWLIGGEEKRETGVDESTWLNFRLKQECKTVFAWLKFVYSLAVALLFTALPLYIIGNHEKIVETAQRLAIIENPFFQYFFLIDYHNFKIWHITRSLAALLTFVIFVYANKLLVAREDIPGYGRESASIILNALGRLRTTFALITIFCGLYLLLDPILGLTSLLQSIDWRRWA